MRRRGPFAIAVLWLCPALLLRAATPAKPAWPLTLKEGLPATLSGYDSAPTESLSDEDENEMGPYTEVSRFFQRIESATSVKQFRLAVQDYGATANLQTSLRKAFEEAKRAGVETRSIEI